MTAVPPPARPPAPSPCAAAALPQPRSLPQEAALQPGLSGRSRPGGVNQPGHGSVPPGVLGAARPCPRQRGLSRRCSSLLAAAGAALAEIASIGEPQHPRPAPAPCRKPRSQRQRKTARLRAGKLPALGERPARRREARLSRRRGEQSFRRRNGEGKGGKKNTQKERTHRAGGAQSQALPSGRCRGAAGCCPARCELPEHRCPPRSCRAAPVPAARGLCSPRPRPRAPGPAAPGCGARTPGPCWQPPGVPARLHGAPCSPRSPLLPRRAARPRLGWAGCDLGTPVSRFTSGIPPLCPAPSSLPGAGRAQGCPRSRGTAAGAGRSAGRPPAGTSPRLRRCRRAEGRRQGRGSTASSPCGDLCLCRPRCHPDNPAAGCRWGLSRARNNPKKAHLGISTRISEPGRRGRASGRARAARRPVLQGPLRAPVLHHRRVPAGAAAPGVLPTAP